MRYILVNLLLVLVLAAVPAVAQTDQSTTPGRNINVPVPKSIAEADNVVLEVKIGTLPKGAEIEINTADGRFLGVISPFGSSPQETDAVATYVIPLPRDLTGEKRLNLLFKFSGAVYSRRAPTSRDIRSVKIKAVPPDAGTAGLRQ